MFADLGISFPLFAAPETEALGYLGLDHCEVCGANGAHAFTCRIDGHQGKACYECLRAGRAWIPKDTVIGAVSASSATRGQTDAVGLRRSDLQGYGFPVVPNDVEPELPDWSYVLVPSSDLLELVRTPDFLTWQGCQWLFCCRKPMVYIGAWKEPDFERHAGSSDPAEFFRSVVVSPQIGPFVWGQHAPLGGAGGPYVFRCQACGRYRGYIDMP
jgi:hypothetical protein